jgi:hypothetical protein
MTRTMIYSLFLAAFAMVALTHIALTQAAALIA